MKKYLVYIKKHLDFIIADMLVLILSYYIVVQIRYALDHVWHGELFSIYGSVLAGVYLVILILSKNLAGVIKRSFFKEAQHLLVQVFVSWAFFTVVLYSVKTAQDFSRSVYASSFVFCYFCLFVERTLLKLFIRFSRFHSNICPKLIVICDGDKSQVALKRVLHGAFLNDYEIAGVVMTDAANNDYIDHFDSVVGLDHLEEFIADKRIDEAFIELSDAAAETQAIKTVLDHDIVAHRSLAESYMNYVEQDIEEISEHYVITIRNTDVSFATKAESIETALFRKFAKR